MNLQDQIKQFLRKSHALKQWAATTLESLELKDRIIRAYKQTLTILKHVLNWTIKTAKQSRKLAVSTYRKTRGAVLQFIDFVVRKKSQFDQWSIKYIKPRWEKFTARTRELLLHAAEAATYTIKTISHYLWQLVCDFTKSFVRNLIAFSAALFRACKLFILYTLIFLVYCGEKFWHYTKLFYKDLIKDCRVSWRVFKKLLALLNKHGKSASIHIYKALVIFLNKSWVLFKYFIALLRKYSAITFRQIDKGFKHTGVLLTLGLIKLWQVLILFGQGLLIIINYLWRLFIRSSLGLFRFTLFSAKAIDRGFKTTGYLLTLFIVRSARLFASFIILLTAAIDQATEVILNVIVQSVRLSGIYIWRSLKFILWFPVILLNLILPRVITNHLKQYALLIRLDKPIGILLLLWPTLIALWIAAEGWPDMNVLLVFIAGVFLMRSAGCAINDFADRNIDPKVERTKNRPLASKSISVVEALVVFAALGVMAFMLVLLMNGLTITMSFIGLALAVTYPFMKRYHYLPQVHLGAAFGWAVPMAFAAQANELAPVAWLLFFATVLWATAYDTMYAMVDREDDILIGAKSTAILFEDADTLIIGIIQAILILCLIMIGTKAELGGLYFLSVVIATGFAAWQQYLIKDRKPSLCFKAFMNNNWFGLILFAGVFLEYQVGSIAY